MSQHTRPFHIALAAAALLGTACDGSDGPLQERAGAFEWRGPAAAGNTLRVRDMNGDITVSPSADDTVRVRADIAWRRGDPDRSLHFTGWREGSDIIICAVWGKGTCTATKYDSEFRSARGTDAKVHFHIEAPAGVKLELVAINGDIAAAASAPVEARTSNGDIRVVTAVGPARGVTMNGSVDLRMASLVGTDSVIAKTLNGDVFVYLPDAPDAAIDLQTMTGSVSTEFPVIVTGEANRRSLRAVLGTATRTVSLRTTNGSASLRRLENAGGAGAP